MPLLCGVCLVVTVLVGDTAVTPTTFSPDSPHTKEAVSLNPPVCVIRFWLGVHQV